MLAVTAVRVPRRGAAPPAWMWHGRRRAAGSGGQLQEPCMASTTDQEEPTMAGLGRFPTHASLYIYI